MPRNKCKHNWVSRLIGTLIVPAVILVTWEITARMYAKPYIYPPFSQVLTQLIHPLRDHYNAGSLLSNTGISLLRVLIGFILAAVAAVPLGMVMGSIPRIRRLIEPTLEILRPLCPIAWLPFAITVFGLHSLPQVVGLDYTRTLFDQLQLSILFVLFVGGFFPILVNTIDAAAGVRENYKTLARALGASKFHVFLYVLLPASLPMILTGLRQGISQCWFVIIAAEMVVGAYSGIGYLLMYAADNSDMDIVITCMIIVGLIGAGLNLLMRRILKKHICWQTKEVG